MSAANRAPDPVLDKPGAPREDVVVSICYNELSTTDEAFSELAKLAAHVDRHFRFREALIIAEASTQDDYLTVVRNIPNVRLITVQDGMSVYQKSVVAAAEAIGDVVVLSNDREINFIDVVEVIERVAQTKKGVMLIRTENSKVRLSLAAPLVALGHLAGFKVGLQNLQTVALPRNHLNQMLQHSDPELALRFPPRDPRVPVSIMKALVSQSFAPDINRRKARVALFHRLLIYVAPSVLSFVSIVATMLCFLGIIYAVYVLSVWALGYDLQPGWATTSIMLSSIASFFGVAILGLSLGLQKILFLLRRDGFESVIDEVNRIDLFAQVALDLNVDLEKDGVQIDLSETK